MPQDTSSPSDYGVGFGSDWRQGVQSLHERQFGEKQMMDMARLSMAQQRDMLNRSVAIQRATIARANYEQKIRETSAASSAIAQISGLDTNSPKYLKQRATIIGNMPDALASPAVQKLLTDGDRAFENYQKAETIKIGAKLSAPARSAYENTLSNTGDPGMAMTAAQSTQENYDRAKKIATSPYLSAADKATVFDPTSGKFNLTDPDNLAKLEVTHDTAENSNKATMEAAKLKVEQATALSLGGPAAAPGAAPTPALPTTVSPVNSAPTPDDEAKRLFGIGAQQAAPAPTPSQTPAATIPGGDELSAAESETKAP
jgi:hypothetical protein